MASSLPRALSPRKTPRQARSVVTVEAIFEATIQLLVADGVHRLTTTKVAERAGVSVGTMYQYFPHKEALIYALNQRYLEKLASKIEETCLAHQQMMSGEMVEALIDTYWKAKTERADVTRALYRSVAELDNQSLIDSFARRVDKATVAMFASAKDVTLQEPETLSLTLVTVIFGTVRNAFERNLSPAAALVLQQQLVMMCQSYIAATHKMAVDD